MNSLYTNSFNLHNFRLYLFIIALIFLSSCQIDQSVNLIKEKLFSDNAEIKDNEKIKTENPEPIIEEKIIENKREDFSKLKNTKELDENKKINKIREEERQNQDKSIEIEKTEIKNKQNDLAFKELGKARDTDSKIISFFSKIFDTKDEELIIKLPDEKLKVVKKHKQLKKEEENQEQNNDQVDLTLVQEEDEVKVEFEEEQGEKDILTNLIENKENNEDDLTSDSVENYENESDDKKDFAFLKLKKPNVEKKKIIETDNLVGLLLPLTGKKSAAGNLVINSLRYSMLSKPNQLNFKIFDTKGNPRGAVEAAKKAVDSGIETFIGPIFSDETKQVKDYFKNKDDLTFFSLSPDVSNVSENVIVSGQSSEDQISCIVQHIAIKRSEKILLIYHADRYGHIIRDSFLKFSDNFGINDYISIEYFEIDNNTNLNNEVKQLSEFEERKAELKREINRIKNDKNLEEDFKRKQIKTLERKLTISNPFDSIVLASEGDKLLEILSHLAFYDINSDNTNIYGTSLWEDTKKDDNAFQGTFYATSLKERNNEFIENFRNIFSRDPMSFNFHIHDLIGLVQNYKISDDKERVVFDGEFSNSKINSGLLQREIFLRKISKDAINKEVFNCRLDVI